MNYDFEFNTSAFFKMPYQFKYIVINLVLPITVSNRRQQILSKTKKKKTKSVPEMLSFKSIHLLKFIIFSFMENRLYKLHLLP